ncbi:GNAT family N-acetyltransferase [Shewanella surugensis]|uniref:GNAT family N-acetyltransferase n=1 Tax=Shewanella surugensis TaxID=212020 RepID=A0ABT0LC83_9GAMM|nr:GNAT family N-acetyltransferase [Shewanella surugensis]MCL1125278.1 GNAT family N-acetyltransferase [Shewanella surugensis]
MVVAETDRLYLRRFIADDAKAVFLLNSMPKILSHLPGSPIKSIEEARRVIIDVALPMYAEFDYGRWAVVHKQDDRVIGYCGPKYLAEYNEVELAFRYLPEYWGQGFATEAAVAAIEECEEYHLTGMIALVLLGNKEYEKVLNKIKMFEIKRDNYLGYKVKIFHRFFNH